MSKQDLYAPAGWNLPKDLEIIRCREGGKEFLKERPNRATKRDFYTLVAEFPLYGQNPDGVKAKKIWKLAKRLARDYLRMECCDAAIICHKPPSRATGRTYDSVCVYSKFLLP